MKFFKNLPLLLSFIYIAQGCGDGVAHVPRPRMYPRIDWPARIDTSLQQSFCNFTFTYPKYFDFKQDVSYFDEKPSDPCWFNLHSSQLNCTLHCSYYPISKTHSFDKLRQDAFEVVSKHNVKAEYRRESLIEHGDVKGLLFEIDGPVASPLQFYISDDKKHFFRASLYFDAKVNPDSTKVVYDFVKKDVDKMLETFQWNKK